MPLRPKLNTQLNSKLSIIFVTASLLISSVFVMATVKDDVAARTAPIGQLCMSGDDCAAAPVTVASGPRSGEDIYAAKCVACHATGAANAPKLGDKGAWVTRIGNGIDVLYSNAINGINGMPAKGLCMDCSDDEIKATVDYMVDNSQ